MLVALEFEIIRNVSTGVGGAMLDLPREPCSVYTLINESGFLDRGHLLLQFETVLFEDRMHDWNWMRGKLRFFARTNDVCDLLVVYRQAERRDELNYCPECGAKIDGGGCHKGHDISKYLSKISE